MVIQRRRTDNAFVYNFICECSIIKIRPFVLGYHPVAPGRLSGWSM